MPDANCLLDRSDHELWSLIAGNLQTAAVAQGFPLMATGYPANTCLSELDDHRLIAIAAYSSAKLASV